ncbi:protein translation factor SUI1 homolog isoform X1 [Juglans microcarpa x Juglans regia]|uniref:protein translation factor SUI1 homolog isoform X1 n=1 Tax=Juglans microcarpa x Juglans regia TaxID=2249226 RepID=UPI001B7ED87D|nr:protein translation factor SUI1 homolog isoform X1 [Juglans microcarpa x Juglans regia]XP_041008675.1 protein translation factor SUI1 homolog isoform X1 [Juglans microcarpa x Juglans regia]
MSELNDQIPTAFDPFAEANAEDSGAGTKEYVHVRIQQRNGRKSLTTVQGLKKEYSYNKILKDLKKEFCCNGTVVQDPELGQVCFHSLVKMRMHFNIPFLVLLLFIFFFLELKQKTISLLYGCRLYNCREIKGRMFPPSLCRLAL